MGAGQAEPMPAYEGGWPRKVTRGRRGRAAGQSARTGRSRGRSDAGAGEAETDGACGAQLGRIQQEEPVRAHAGAAGGRAGDAKQRGRRRPARTREPAGLELVEACGTESGSTGRRGRCGAGDAESGSAQLGRIQPEEPVRARSG